MSAVRLSPEAIQELAEAAAWYMAQQPGLERKFLLPADLVIRRALLPRFPYP